MSTPNVVTKLPKVGTTIFTVMSALAAQHQAVNLGQGFPDFECDSRLSSAVTEAMQAGHNQYPPMAGNVLLRERVSAKFEAIHGVRFDPMTDITITSGATQGILSALLAIVRTGDEVIVLEPCYDSYVPNIELCGGIAVPVRLSLGTFTPDFDAIARAITSKTRAIIVNTPHNPTARTWSREAWRTLGDLLAGRDIFVVSDEVYEHMVFDGRPHWSAVCDERIRERAFIISSFGKTFHVTGWKIGTVCAPSELSAEFRKVHQYTVFTANSAMQQGLATYLADSAPYLTLPVFYQAKRDRFVQALAGTSLRALASEGSYFVCTNYEAVTPLRDLNERDACEWLTREVGVTPIPVSAFYSAPVEQKTIRFCFAKRDQTLDEAVNRLQLRLAN